jgi:hypothetical protein
MIFTIPIIPITIFTSRCFTRPAHPAYRVVPNAPERLAREPESHAMRVFDVEVHKGGSGKRWITMMI